MENNHNPEEHALSDKDNDEPRGKRGKEARLDDGDDHMLNGGNDSGHLYASIPGFMLDTTPSASAGLEKSTTLKQNSHREDSTPNAPAGLGFAGKPVTPKQNSHRGGFASSAPTGTRPPNQVQFQGVEDLYREEPVRARRNKDTGRRQDEKPAAESHHQLRDDLDIHEEPESRPKKGNQDSYDDDEEPAFSSGREIEITKGQLVGYFKVGTGSKFICQLGPKRCGQYRLFSSASNPDWKIDVEEDKRRPKVEREYYDASDRTLRKLKSPGSRKNYRGIAGVAHESGTSMDPSQRRMPRTLIKIAWTDAPSTWETRTDFRSLRGKKDADQEIFDAVVYYKKEWDTFNGSDLGWPDSSRARSATPAYSTSQPSTRQPSEVPRNYARNGQSQRSTSSAPPGRQGLAKSHKTPSRRQPSEHYAHNDQSYKTSSKRQHSEQPPTRQPSEVSQNYARNGQSQHFTPPAHTHQHQQSYQYREQFRSPELFPTNIPERYNNDDEFYSE